MNIVRRMTLSFRAVYIWTSTGERKTRTIERTLVHTIRATVNDRWSRDVAWITRIRRPYVHDAEERSYTLSRGRTLNEKARRTHLARNTATQNQTEREKKRERERERRRMRRKGLKTSRNRVGQRDTRDMEASVGGGDAHEGETRWREQVEGVLARGASFEIGGSYCLASLSLFLSLRAVAPRENRRDANEQIKGWSFTAVGRPVGVANRIDD